MALKPNGRFADESWREVTVDDLKAPGDNSLATGPFGSSIGSRFFQESGIPVIRGSNLSEDSEIRLIDEGFVFLSEKKAAEFRRSTVRGGDLIFTCWGTINQVGLVDESAKHREYVISNKQMKFTPDPRKADSLFLYYLFSSPQINTSIARQSIGSSVPGFNLGQLRAIRLMVPGLPEQRAIATALSDADALIESLEQLVAKKRRLKQGAMQELLTGKRRLPGFSGEWTTTRLGSISQMVSGGTPPSDRADFYGGHIPWVSISDMTESGKFISATERHLTVAGLTNSAAKIFPVGTVLYAMYASLGECSITTVPLCSSQAILGITCGQELNSDFLYYFLISQKSIVKSMGQHGTQANLNKGMVQGFQLDLPPRSEQSAIAAVLSDMDVEIDALEAKLAKARQIKQGMMQELLTGRTRLV